MKGADTGKRKMKAAHEGGTNEGGQKKAAKAAPAAGDTGDPPRKQSTDPTKKAKTDPDAARKGQKVKFADSSTSDSKPAWGSNADSLKPKLLPQTESEEPKPKPKRRHKNIVPGSNIVPDSLMSMTSKSVGSVTLPVLATRYTETNEKAAAQANARLVLKIYETFGFEHTEGTDALKEVAVVKVILKREGQLENIIHLCEGIRRKGVIEKNILPALLHLRETTLTYLDLLVDWRKTYSFEDAADRQPLTFQWEGRNYTAKIMTDLDFLADNELIVETLALPAFQLRSNPLMLPSNLENSSDDWEDEPRKRAMRDMRKMELEHIREEEEQEQASPAVRRSRKKMSPSEALADNNAPSSSHAFTGTKQFETRVCM